MARKKRIVYPGHCCHVMIRGVGGRRIFDDDQDRIRFCLLLQYASETCEFSIHGFCLMDNHVHLLLQPHTEDLASGMHRLGFRYAQHFNKKFMRQGYLFQGRYKATVVQHGVYLSRLIRYIHRNPVRANLVGNLYSYPWSSHPAYVGDSQFTWLRTDLVLPLFGADPHVALEMFQKYVCSGDEEAKIELEEIRKSTKMGAYGSELFLEDYRNALECDSSLSELGKLPGLQGKFSENQTKITLEMLVKSLNEITSFSLDELRSARRTVQLVEARAVFVRLALKFKLSSTRELASLLDRDPTSIARLEQRIQMTPKLSQLVDEISSTLLLRRNLDPSSHR